MTNKQRTEQSKLTRELKDRKARGGEWTIFQKKVITREEKDKLTQEQPFQEKRDAPPRRESQ